MGRKKQDAFQALQDRRDEQVRRAGGIATQNNQVRIQQAADTGDRQAEVVDDLSDRLPGPCFTAARGGKYVLGAQLAVGRGSALLGQQVGGALDQTGRRGQAF